MPSPTERTLAALRADGLTAGIVERRMPPYPGHPYGKTFDYLGIIDIIAIDEERTVAVQSTGTGFSEHLLKMFNERYDSCFKWLQCPHRTLQLWGWRKLKVARGKKKKVYVPRIADFFIEDGELVYEERPRRPA